MTDTHTPHVAPGPNALTAEEQRAGGELLHLLGLSALRSIRIFGTASPFWAGMDRLLRAGIHGIGKETP